jgi:hypothetical protein
MGLDDFQQPTRDLLAVLGEQVTAVRGTAAPVALLAFVDDAVQTVGQRGQVYGNKRVVAMMVADWQPQRGDQFTVRGKASKVEEVMQDDGVVVTVVLHG